MKRKPSGCQNNANVINSKSKQRFHPAGGVLNAVKKNA